ncbi:hypothetical protein Cs308_0757 [Candidatus Chlamydia sanziniae]|uniref:Uncharacterized protein n=1 Tax=Candidatus Chlamydia sanziniae TaxID=1806891 RepID=A0A1A9HW53_9CHLA|nr:hypothetical protein Cs308_0757 [Candidatus Chlamydia sanziniae]
MNAGGKKAGDLFMTLPSSFTGSLASIVSGFARVTEKRQQPKF